MKSVRKIESNKHIQEILRRVGTAVQVKTSILFKRNKEKCEKNHKHSYAETNKNRTHLNISFFCFMPAHIAQCEARNLNEKTTKTKTKKSSNNHRIKKKYKFTVYIFT